MIITMIWAGAAAFGAMEDYFPIDAGNEWVYQNQRGAAWKIRIGEPVEIGGRLYHTLEGYTASPVLVRKNDAGDLVRWDEASGVDTVLTRFEGKFASGAGFCREEGEVQTDPERFPQPGRALRALAIRYRISGCADAGIESELYGANLGLLRRVTQSIIGPVSFDLVRARVGSITFNGTSAGVVSVQLARAEVPRPPVGQPLRVAGSISVDVSGAGPLELEFLSTQRFNVVLVSREGEHLWTWSADKLFAAVTARESWTGRRDFDWELNVPADVAARLGEQMYRVECWITATGQRPGLSSAAPLRVGAVN